MRHPVRFLRHLSHPARMRRTGKRHPKSLDKERFSLNFRPEGAGIVITRHGKPVAELVPVTDRKQDVAETIEGMRRARERRPYVPLDELLAARHEGHKY
jgi:antitoxin (DNA-binding transcriptional repressor) of toxin-antitoxin stability system